MLGKSFCSKSRVLTSRLYNGDQTSSLFRWAPQAKSLSRSQRAWSKLLPKAVHWSQCRSGPSSSLRDSPPIANERTAYSDGFFCGRREILVSLLLEGRVIQADLRRRLARKRYDPSEGISRAFSRLMIQGKVKAALRLLSTQSRGEVLDPDAILPGGDNAEASPKTVLDVLREKHPPASPIHPDALLDFRTGTQPSSYL